MGRKRSPTFRMGKSYLFANILAHIDTYFITNLEEQPEQIHPDTGSS